MWSDKPSRELASVCLYDAIRQQGLSAHDARILVWFVAERMHTGAYYHYVRTDLASYRCVSYASESAGRLSLMLCDLACIHHGSLNPLENLRRTTALVLCSVHDRQRMSPLDRRCQAACAHDARGGCPEKRLPCVGHSYPLGTVRALVFSLELGGPREFQSRVVFCVGRVGQSYRTGCAAGSEETWRGVVKHLVSD